MLFVLEASDEAAVPTLHLQPRSVTAALLDASGSSVLYGPQELPFLRSHIANIAVASDNCLKCSCGVGSSRRQGALGVLVYVLCSGLR